MMHGQTKIKDIISSGWCLKVTQTHIKPSISASFNKADFHSVRHVT